MYFRGKACSENNSLLDRIDSRVQHIWRLLIAVIDDFLAPWFITFSRSVTGE